MQNSLTTPYRLNGLTLKNRFVMAPMTRDMSTGGVPGKEQAEYYARRVRGGVGLIISEGAWISHEVAVNRSAVPRFHGDDALAGWKQIIDAVHAEGGIMFPQLWHTGGARDPKTDPYHPELPSVGPSGVALTFTEVVPGGCAELDIPGIEAIVAAYARAAREAYSLGFDGLELHAAHGYMIDQFLWEETNRRTDAYGGSPRARVRFATEVVRACRAATSPAFPISFRFSQWKVPDYDAKPWQSEEDLQALLLPLCEAGVDIFHCSTRRFWEPAWNGARKSLAGLTKEISGKTVIAVGSVGLDVIYAPIKSKGTDHGAKAKSIEDVVAAVDRGDFDLVAVGRAILSDPEWVNKVCRDAQHELVTYTPELRTVLT